MKETIDTYSGPTARPGHTTCTFRLFDSFVCIVSFEMVY